jgi:hypothetical protein
MEGNEMAGMHDIFPNAQFQPTNLAAFKIQNMFLFPPAWAGCALPAALTWSFVRFDPAQTANVPDDQRGVYSFVVQPGIANHPACSYLLYLGKTERNFRIRYQEYLRDESAGIESRRPHISGMLCKWKGYLWFCYAHIADPEQIVPTEDALLASYLPPTNVEMPGKLNQKIAFLLGT